MLHTDVMVTYCTYMNKLCHKFFSNFIYVCIKQINIPSQHPITYTQMSEHTALSSPHQCDSVISGKIAMDPLYGPLLWILWESSITQLHPRVTLEANLFFSC